MHKESKSHLNKSRVQYYSGEHHVSLNTDSIECQSRSHAIFQWSQIKCFWKNSDLTDSLLLTPIFFSHHRIILNHASLVICFIRGKYQKSILRSHHANVQYSRCFSTFMHSIPLEPQLFLLNFKIITISHNPVFLKNVFILILN